MRSPEGLKVREVDFAVPGSVDPSDFGLEGLTSAAARLSVDLSPTSGLGTSRLGQVRRVDGSTLTASGRCWFSLRTAAGPGALLIDPSLAVVVADRLMGGSGQVDSRSLTAVEERVLVPHLQRAMVPLGHAFTPAGLSPIEVREPGRGSLGLRGDMLLVEVVVWDSPEEQARSRGSLLLALPSPVIARHASQQAAAQGPAHGMGPFLDVRLPLSVATLPLPVPASALVALRPGEVLRSRHKVDTPLSLLAGGALVATATLDLTGPACVAHVRQSLIHQDVGQPSSSWRTRRVRAVLGPADPLNRRRQDHPAGAPTDPVIDPASPEGEPPMSLQSPDPDSPVAAALAAARDAADALDGSGTPPRLPAEAHTTPAAALGALAEVPVEVTVEVGRASITLRDAVSLSPGQVITLDAAADSLAAILVNGHVVARGQVVVVDDAYGVRVSEMAGE